MKILCVGQEWRGSNASGLFYALSRQGCITNIINEQIYIPAAAGSRALKAVHRLLRPWQISDFNQRLDEHFRAFKPDVVLVYKGAYIHPASIRNWKSKAVPVIVFYPDVSFMAHGSLIPKCIPLYDHIFSTKTFAADDLERLFNYPRSQVSFIPHGFAPEIHKPQSSIANNLQCQVSFIGNYSPHKATLLEQLIEAIPSLDLKIWGGTWKQYDGRTLANCIQYQHLIGDAYVAAINASEINLGILSEKVEGASSGDMITSRTFHIPGAKGFMLHQRTSEAVQYFEENKEAVFFDGPEELVAKVQYYLMNPEERLQIAARGHERAIREYSLDARAQQLLAILKQRNIIP